MRTKSLGTGLALVIALAVMLSAVAMWYDVLKIHATITTGKVDVEFVEASCTDVGADPQADGFSNGEGKDVATCEVSFEKGVEEGPDDDDLDLVITVSNAYPGYLVEVCFTVKNAGTIPVKGPYTFVNGELKPINGLGIVQLDEEGTYKWCLSVSIDQEAKENTTYEWQLHLVFVQWNEAPPVTPTPD